MKPSVKTVEELYVSVSDSRSALGDASGIAAAEIIRRAIRDRGRARVIFAAAPSQDEMLAVLTRQDGIDWKRVEAFHMDEYVGLALTHPQSFGQWLDDRLQTTGITNFERMRTQGDLDEEIQRYSTLLSAAPVDLACMGIGVNGHIAFNEPHHARFDDPELVRSVVLDEESRIQQVDDGCFEELVEVPTHAVTLTIPALMAACNLIVTVSGLQKSNAVYRALTGSVNVGCPASIIRTHDHTSIFLDSFAAEKLKVTPAGGAG